MSDVTDASTGFIRPFTGNAAAAWSCESRLSVFIGGLTNDFHDRTVCPHVARTLMNDQTKIRNQLVQPSDRLPNLRRQKFGGAIDEEQKNDA